MPKRVMSTIISAYNARNRLGSLLRQIGRSKVRFVITRSGKPTAVLLAVTDFDDMLEELDPEFQKSLKVAAKEYRAGKATPLRDYMKERLAVRRAS